MMEPQGGGGARSRPWVLFIVPLLVAVGVVAGVIVVVQNQTGADEGPVGMFTQVSTDSGGCPASERLSGAAEGKQAAEVQGIHAWVNSDPLCLSDLRGKVVLVDFWTYTCVNCIRTFPFLREWYSRYADDGLVILGVHSPEFEFEKDLDNVRNATIEHDIKWPVALDNDFGTWRAYNNRYWPAKYLIDKDGIVRYTHFGEGEYAETEERIRELLVEAGASLSNLRGDLPEDQERDQAFLDAGSRVITPELYAGYHRGCDPFFGSAFVFNPEYCRSLDEVYEYEDSKDHRPHLIYLQGPWRAGSESLNYTPRELTDEYKDYLAIKVWAKSVNAVIKPTTDGAPFKVLVTADGEYLTDENKGADVVIEDDGRSFLVVDDPKLYLVVEAPAYGTFELKMFTNSPRFDVFAFTFGIYESGA